MVASPPVSSPSAPESSATISTANFPVLQHFFMAYSGGGKKLVAAKLVPFTLQNQPLPSARVASSGSLLHAKRQRNVAKRKVVDRGNVDGLGVVGNQENGAINLSVKDNLERNNNNNDDDHRSSVSVFDGSEYLFPDSNVSDGGRDDRGKKRRRQTSVPEQNKDQRYWVRRLKNNEAAKRSRDMRIQREKILFDENARLEARSTELLLEKQQLLTDNKELQLKMDLILGENARLKATVQQFQHQDFEFIPSGSASQSPP